MGTLEYIRNFMKVCKNQEEYISYNGDKTSAVCESSMGARTYTYESVWKEIEENGISTQSLLSIEDHKKQSGIISDIITIEMID